MRNKDDKNLNISTGRDFIYTITHGIGGIWFAIIISICKWIRVNLLT